MHWSVLVNPGPCPEYRRTLADLSGLSYKVLLRAPSDRSPKLLIPRDAKVTREVLMKCRSDQHVSHMALCSKVLLTIVSALPSAPSYEPAHDHTRYRCQRTRPYREQQVTPSPRTSRPSTALLLSKLDPLRKDKGALLDSNGLWNGLAGQRNVISGHRTCSSCSCGNGPVENFAIAKHEIDA